MIGTLIAICFTAAAGLVTGYVLGQRQGLATAHEDYAGVVAQLARQRDNAIQRQEDMNIALDRANAELSALTHDLSMLKRRG